MKADKLNYGRRTRKMYVNDENLKKLEDKRPLKIREAFKDKNIFYQLGDLIKYESQIYKVQVTITVYM